MAIDIKAARELLADYQQTGDSGDMAKIELLLGEALDELEVHKFCPKERSGPLKLRIAELNAQLDEANRKIEALTRFRRNATKLWQGAKEKAALLAEEAASEWVLTEEFNPTPRALLRLAAQIRGMDVEKAAEEKKAAADSEEARRKALLTVYDREGSAPIDVMLRLRDNGLLYLTGGQFYMTEKGAYEVIRLLPKKSRTERGPK